MFKKKGLTPKQEQFCQEYLIDLNATKAAERAGFSSKTAQQQGARLLLNVVVSERLSELQNKRSEKIQVNQDYVLKVIIDTIERCQQAEPVMMRDGNEWVESGEYKFDSQAVLKGAELLGKHLAMFTDKSKVEHSGKVKIRIGYSDDGRD